VAHSVAVIGLMIRHAVGDALLVERLDAAKARRGVKMIVVAPNVKPIFW
jgi:hypothetical protein